MKRVLVLLVVLLIVSGLPTKVAAGGMLTIDVGNQQTAKVFVNNSSVTYEVNGVPGSAGAVDTIIVNGTGEVGAEIEANRSNPLTLRFNPTSRMEAKVKAQGSGHLTVSFAGGGGEDKLELEAENSSAITVTANTGGGEDQLGIGGKSIGGADLTLNTGGGEDQIKVELETRGGHFPATINIDSGGGPFGDEDTNEVKIVGNATLSGVITTGLSDDKIKVEVDGSVETSGLTVIGGNGDDELNVTVKNSLTGSGTLSLGGEAGNDKLKTEVGGGSGTVTLNGGAGFDECVGPGLPATSFDPSCEIADF